MRYFAVLLSLMCMVFAADAAQDSAKADKRVAFVVGNGAYKNVAALPNPPIDAKAMAAVLRNVGFEVVGGTNLTRDTMTERLLEFGKKAQGADVAVFFYAGHGIAIGGTNYLLPIDADIKSEMDVKLGAAINIDLTLDQTMSDAKVKLVFLDACRDNPFAAKIKSNATTRNLTSVDPAAFNADSNQVTEDQIGLDKGQRRDVQRRLNGLGFDTKVSGRFDEATRAVIMRWQAARGYPKSGYLNQLQHKALLTEIVSAQASSSDEDSDGHSSRRHHGGGGGGGGHRYYRGGGGPGGFIGGVVGGLFR